jgi:hypothetical protein
MTMSPPSPDRASVLGRIPVKSATVMVGSAEASFAAVADDARLTAVVADPSLMLIWSGSAAKLYRTMSHRSRPERR